MSDPDDPPPIGLHYEGPQQQPAQHPTGERAPMDHDHVTPAPVPPPSDDWKYRSPDRDIVGHRQAALESESNRAEEGDTDEYVPVNADILAAQLDGAREACLEKDLRIDELTSQRDELLAACQLDELCEQHRRGNTAPYELKDRCFELGMPPKKLVGEFVVEFRRAAIARAMGPQKGESSVPHSSPV